jgi:hypothetical protein
MRILNIRATAGVLAAVLLLFLLGFRVAHPDSGIGTALGTADSSLVIYKKSQTTDYEAKILAVTSDGKTGLGVVAGTDTKQVYLSLGDRYETVKAQNIKGKLLLVVPFLGSVVGIVGL